MQTLAPPQTPQRAPHAPLALTPPRLGRVQPFPCESDDEVALLAVAHVLAPEDGPAAAELLDAVAACLGAEDRMGFSALCAAVARHYRATGRDGRFVHATLEAVLQQSAEFTLTTPDSLENECTVAWAGVRRLWQAAFRRALLEIVQLGSAEPETLSQLCGRVLAHGPHPKWGYLLKCVGSRIFHPHHTGKGDERKLFLRLRRDASVEGIAALLSKLDRLALEMADIHLREVP